MCMMKNSGEKEACEVAKNLAALDGRVTKVEERMNKMEGSLNDIMRLATLIKMRETFTMVL